MLFEEPDALYPKSGAAAVVGYAVSQLTRILEMIQSTISDASALFLGHGDPGSRLSGNGSSMGALPSRILTTLTGLMTDIDVATMLPSQADTNANYKSDARTDHESPDSHHITSATATSNVTDTKSNGRPIMPRQRTKRRNLSMVGALITSTTTTSQPTDYSSTASVFTQVLNRLTSDAQSHDSLLGLPEVARAKRQSSALSSLVSTSAQLMSKYLPDNVLDYLPALSSNILFQIPR